MLLLDKLTSIAVVDASIFVPHILVASPLSRFEVRGGKDPTNGVRKLEGSFLGPYFFLLSSFPLPLSILRPNTSGNREKWTQNPGTEKKTPVGHPSEFKS